MHIHLALNCQFLLNILANTECVIEEDISNHSNDINDGRNDPKQYDAESCKSFCKSTYPTAKYFKWVSPYAAWTPGHNTCWCKYSDSDRRDERGQTSGDVTCGDSGGGKYLCAHRRKGQTPLLVIHMEPMAQVVPTASRHLPKLGHWAHKPLTPEQSSPT